MVFIEKTYPAGDWRYLFVVLWQSNVGSSRDAVTTAIHAWCSQRYGITAEADKYGEWCDLGNGAYGFRRVEQAIEFKMRWQGADMSEFDTED